MFFTAGRSLQCVKCGQIMDSNCRSLASVATTVHCPLETSNYVLSCVCPVPTSGIEKKGTIRKYEKYLSVLYFTTYRERYCVMLFFMNYFKCITFFIELNNMSNLRRNSSFRLLYVFIYNMTKTFY